MNRKIPKKRREEALEIADSLALRFTLGASVADLSGEFHLEPDLVEGCVRRHVCALQSIMREMYERSRKVQSIENRASRSSI